MLWANNVAFKFLKDILLNRENFQNWSHAYTHIHIHRLNSMTFLLSMLVVDKAPWVFNNVVEERNPTHF